MTGPSQTQTQAYSVRVERRNESQALAEARGHHLTLNIKKGDGSAGFNAAETLLAALGTCILTNVNAIADKMRVEMRAVHVELEAIRSDEPPTLTHIGYRLVVDSPESVERLERVHELALSWGTVTNTLINGVVPSGVLEIRGKSAVVDTRRDNDA